MTESLFDLGLGDVVVGITDYCIYPAELLKNLPRVGGTKDVSEDEILDLKPDFVIANQEENSRQLVEKLEAAGIRVWVTFPKSVREMLDVLWTLTGIFQSRMAAARLETLELSLEWAQSAVIDKRPIRYFCPIWYDKTNKGQPWWMTFNQYTYSHDLLAMVGGLNTFSQRERRHPLEADLGMEQAQDPLKRDTRYPRLLLAEIRVADPEIILLPDEPFSFEHAHRLELEALLADTAAVRNGRVYQVEGSLITWHGTRLGRALQELPSLFWGIYS
ncbi:MAG: ABC transporter substrate-binding protein [Anaerolineales bacterium]|nr:ABC transporter substrate-binding protein [Anaerolineales bacterium]